MPTAATCWRRSASPSIDALFADVPQAARHRRACSTCRGRWANWRSSAASARWRRRTSAPASVPFFLGGGAYRHHVPAAVDHLIQRGEFLTSYTPYQPEVAQGTLQYLFEFQTQVALLTGMEVANASLYDGATACAEAVAMAGRVTRPRQGGAVGRAASALPRGVRDLRPVRRQPAGDPGRRRRAAARISPALIDGDTSCVVVQNPDFYGEVRDYSALAEICHRAGRAAGRRRHRNRCRWARSARPARWAPTSSPPRASRFGNALNFGGPYVGLFATREKFVRQMPGRLVGETVDADGRRGWVLTLSTREQHIRREKATSNICTNSGLCALAFTIHLSLLGEAGLTRLARLNHATAVSAAERLAAIPGVRAGQPAASSTSSRCGCRGRRRRSSRRWPERGILAGVPVSRFYPERRRSGRSAAGRGDRDRHRRRHRPARRRAQGGAAMNEWSQALSARPAARRRRPRSRRSAAIAGCRSRSR